MKRLTKRRMIGLGAFALVGSMTIAACGSSSGGQATSSGLPSTVTIDSLSDLTGQTAFLGKQAANGIQIALTEINDQKFLGDTTLKVDTTDLGSNQQTAAAAGAKAAADHSIPLVIANSATPVAAAVAPIMQREKVPFISSTSGVTGINLGEYTYVMATPLAALEHLGAAYLQAKGATRLGSIYDSGNPTLTDAATKGLPGLATKYGLTPVGTVGVSATSVDLSAPINKLLNANANSLFIGLAGAGATTAIQQATQHGFHGTFLASAGVAGGVLKPAGKAAAGVTWFNDFSATSSLAASQTFTKKYEAAFGGEVPIQPAAYGYDALWMAARALKAAGSTDRQKVLAALQTVASTGFDSPRGQVKFVDRVAAAPGVLVQWDGTKEIGVPTP